MVEIHVVGVVILPTGGLGNRRTPLRGCSMANLGFFEVCPSGWPAGFFPDIVGNCST